MNTRVTSTLGAVILLLALISCSDDDSPTGGGSTADTTPPTITSVNPVDAFHVDVTFSEPITKSSAVYRFNYQVGGMGIVGVSLQDDQKTVTLTTDASMAGQDFDLTVEGVSDVHGNAIDTPVVESFTGSDTPDTTPPQVISVSPSPNAVNTSVGAPVIIRFSEVITGTTVTWLSEGREIGYYARFQDWEYTAQNGGSVVWIMPRNPLELNSVQTITLADLHDYAGNAIAATFQWSFTTTSAVDDTPPTLVSTTPANDAKNVGLNTKLSFTFSEPMNESIDLSIQLTPVPGYPHYWSPWALGKTWSNGGKTVTIEHAPLHDNEQYNLTIEPSNAFDLAMNRLQGLHTIMFTTGSEFHEGSISGTIAGDPGSEAEDPTGAMVLAIDYSMWRGAQYKGSTIVADDDTYTIPHLRDDEYQLWAFFDSNDDGTFDIYYGDAFGMYGMWDAWDQPVEVPEIEVEGRVHVTSVYFPIFDPSALVGRVSNDDWTTPNWDVKAGLFDTVGFSPTDSPAFAMQLYSPDDPLYFNSASGLLDGQYYVGAFMDLNHNGVYDTGTEAAGFYGGVNSPTPLDVFDGADFLDIVIELGTPSALTTTSIPWPAAKPNEKFKQMCETIQKAIASK